MGSNPIPSIECSDRSTSKIGKKERYGTVFHKNKDSFKSKNRINIIDLSMRDLYNRDNLREHWINKISTDLIESDRKDVLAFVEHLENSEKSVLWIVRCISALLLIRKNTDKPFAQLTKDDIKNLFKWMNEKRYKASTHEKFRVILKSFYKIVYGNNETYPEPVKWFPVNVSKEKRMADKKIDVDEYLDEKEVQSIIMHAPNIQKKAFISCMYESGARPEEFLRLTNRDLKIDSDGAVLVLRGKTGERRVRIIAFVPLLQQWLDIHPLNNKEHYPLWISEATNYKNKPLGLRGAEKIVENSIKKAGLTNKHCRLYILRHSRATHLSKYLTEAQMWVYFGWTPGTKVVRNYIHLSGKDIDSTLVALNNNNNDKHPKVEEYKLKPIKCIRCSENLSPNANFCNKCSLSANVANSYFDERKIQENNQFLENQVNLLKEQVLSMKNQMHELVISMDFMDQKGKNQYAKRLYEDGFLKMA